MAISLETGLFGLCEKSILKDEGFLRGLKNRDSIRVDTELFRAYRLYRLKETLRYAYANSAFYRELYDSAGVDVETVRSLEDLQRLPFTTPEDVARGGFRFLCVSQGQVEKPVSYISTGTTGLKKRVFFSRRDIADIMDFLAVGMDTVAMPGSVVQILLPDAQGRGIGPLLAKALQAGGLRAYATGMELDSEEQIRQTMENRPDIWFGDAATVYRITKQCERGCDLSSLGVRIMFLTMEHVSESVTRNLERIWNCRVCTHYGLTEMGWGLAVDCPSGQGYHYNEFGVVAELVDPMTGRPVGLDGAEGELVFTSLGREAMPLIRYRSHDIATLTSKPCSCGCGLQTMGHIGRRMEGVRTLEGGGQIYPAMFDDAVFGCGPVVGYDMFLDSKENRLVLRVETAWEEAGLSGRLAGRIQEIQQVRGMAPPRILLRDTQGRTAPAGKRMIREWTDDEQ